MSDLAKVILPLVLLLIAASTLILVYGLRKKE